MRVLVANAGSSSLKLSLLDSDDSELWARELPAPRAVIEDDAVADALAELPAAPQVVGHRIVHGGERFRAAARLDPGVLGELRELTALAPFHQPKSLAAVEAVSRARPGVPAVACFDTAFHASLPAEAATYALPPPLARALRRAPLRLPRAVAFLRGAPRPRAHRHAEAAGQLPPRRRRVPVRGAGRPLGQDHDGLHAARRPGDGDALRHGRPRPAALAATARGPVDEMADALEHDSGLLGLAGTADMRELLARDDPEASLALGVYLHRLRAGIGAMAAALEGLDALVFTGGVGRALGAGS